MADRFLKAGQSFEEYHKFAFDAPRRREKTIFQVLQVNVRDPEDYLSFYPEFKTWTFTVGYFSNLDETHKAILRCIDESRKRGDMVYCFNVMEYPLGRVSEFEKGGMWRTAIREYLFDEAGELVHGSLASGVMEDEYTPYGAFIGRPKELMKFEVGDYVEVREEHEDKVYLALLAANPVSDEKCYKEWYLKHSINSKVRLGYATASDDNFWVIQIHQQGFVDSVPLCTVMKARFPMLPWVEKRYEYFRKLDRREEQEWQKRDELYKIRREKMNNISWSEL